MKITIGAAFAVGLAVVASHSAAQTPAATGMTRAAALAVLASSPGTVVAEPPGVANSANGLIPAPPQTNIAAPTPVEVIREGTEVKVRLDKQLSSKTATAGDTFGVTVDEELSLPDGVIIPAGFHGEGEVTEVHKVEMIGKPGELSVRLDYIRVGDVRVHLRGSEGREGKSNQTTAIILTLLVSPLFLIVHGHNMVYPQGQEITAYVNEDASVPLPIPAPQPTTDPTRYALLCQQPPNTSTAKARLENRWLVQRPRRRGLGRRAPSVQRAYV